MAVVRLHIVLVNKGKLNEGEIFNGAYRYLPICILFLIGRFYIDGRGGKADPIGY